MRILTKEEDERHLEGTCVPLCADDQWIDRSILYGRKFHWHWRNAAAARAEEEFKRSLLACPRVAVNRSYFYNGDLFAALLEHDAKGLRILLSNGSIRCILHRDTDSELTEAHAGGALNSRRSKQAEVWKRICDLTDIEFIRLRKSHHKQLEACSQIEVNFSRRVEEFAEGSSAHLVALEKYGGNDVRKRAVTFAPRLKKAIDTAIAANKGGPFTRSQLYRRLVVEDESELDETQIDISGKRPFSRELKQAIDLIYNSTATDAFGFRTFISQHMVDRPDIGQSPAPAAMLSAQEIAGIAAIIMSERLRPLVDERTIRIGSLSLSQIEEIRSSQAWRNYRDAPERMAQAITSGERGGALVERFEHEVEKVNAACRALCADVAARYGEAVVEGQRPRGRAIRFSLMLGSNKLGEGAVKLVGAVGAVAGLHLAGLPGALIGGIGGFVAGSVAAQQVERRGTLLMGKLLGGVEASRLPAFQLGDASETLSDLITILETDHGIRLATYGKVADDLPVESIPLGKEAGGD